MRALYRIVSIVAMAAFTLTSCSNQQSLQEYYVDNQENKDFILIDLPMNILNDQSTNLTEEQKRVLKSVRKVNMIAYPINENNKANYAAEQAKVSQILASGKYEQLMSAKHEDGKMKLYYLGEEDAIDEVIAFVASDKQGFAIARLLGDNMNLGDMIRLAENIEKGDIDLSGLEGVMDVFKEVQ